MPSLVGSYDGKGIPDNFLHLFERAIRMQKWLMPVACHMLTYNLKDSARIWWNSQKAGSILNYEDLKAKFRSQFYQQKREITLKGRGNHPGIMVRDRKLRSQTEEAVRSGQLSHLVKRIKKERKRTSDNQRGEKKEKSTTPVEAPICQDLWERVQLLMQGFAIPVFSPGDDPIACLNKTMAFLTAVASLRVIVQQVQGRQGQSYSGTSYKSNATSFGETMQVDTQRLLNATTVKTEDLDTYDSDCDDISNAKAVLMAIISNYGSNVISEVPHFETYLNDMENQAEQAFWLRMFNPTSKSFDASLVKIEAPKGLPKVFKDQFDSIKKTRVRTKEQSDSLIDKANLKSAENEDLKALIQDKVFVVTS
uniref:Reverse transcriptase domain-containing protein n=1 Tax=Tanacetum cinerariifolium TaxID=118510 RepID=A0A6L2P2K7_TANCI|nr:reverse transcriptase domain-containing protein [Tanacetum cinerariifolium]